MNNMPETWLSAYYPTMLAGLDSETSSGHIFEIARKESLKNEDLQGVLVPPPRHNPNRGARIAVDPVSLAR